MTNYYFKSLILFLLLFCFTANVISAKQTFLKAKIQFVNEVNEHENFDENSDFKEEIMAEAFFHFYVQPFLNSNADHWKESISRFNLPKSHQELPERPPKK